ncbi:SpoIID/LytB domain-containing protein [Paenibacillus caui]|uniref:SpoIID/LytB domain-containing protein n=1 Tax=Paenibacillus caui TaxID=2873927 RepID=UPI001CA9D6B4|nr:SpoIID/LytB domain-containing protein [Paenibacillus caui]
MKRAKRYNNLIKWSRGFGAGLLLLGMLHTPAAAESAGQNTVRVAMFLDLGSTYKSTAPAVTLQSPDGLAAGPRTENGFQRWVQIEAGKQARFSINGYRVKALQTTEWSTVAAAAKKLQATSHKPTIFSEDADGKKIYQLYTGSYATAADAEKAADSVAGTLGGLTDLQQPEVRGGLYLSAGVFASAFDAESLCKQIVSQGIDAWRVLTPGSGNGSYSVWVGEAASDTQLAAVKDSVLAKFPELQLSAVDASQAALVIQSDTTNDLAAPAPLPHYMLIGNGAKLWVESGTGSGITEVKERSARKYRGGFEISSVNGQLALVNELPLEQYLYSVVGGEVPSSWSLEALKAQAVAARSFALYQPASKFKVAGLVDTTLSQVYSGIGTEADSIVQAVDSTAGEVLKSNGELIEGVFSANGGGMTADSTEVWNNPSTIYTAVASSEDKAAAEGLKQWYHVLLSSGQSGYVREDNVKLTGTSNAAGLNSLTVTASNVNVRPLPMIQSSVNPVTKMNPGDQALVLEKVNESGSYAWVRGPFTSDQLLQSLKGKTSNSIASPITSLEVTQRGPSGRAIQVKANGEIVQVKYPDLFRSAFGGLPSTLFDIVQTGRYTVLGAGGQTASGTAAAGTAVLSASGTKTLSGSHVIVMNGNREARIVDQSNRFLFVGQGNGHGLGMSQWGAKGIADEGYDYMTILQHYYQNVTITKE